MSYLLPQIPRYPVRMSQEDFYPFAYRYMYYSHALDERFKELFRKGHAKGTVVFTAGAEATAVGMALPFRPDQDVISVLHRDMAAHMLMGMTPYALICQHMANAESPTHGREGNVHHGDASTRRFPMISHLGNMLSTAVGGTWAARNKGEDVYGLAVIGDGGTSTGDFHESLNIASVKNVPVLFVIENNHYAFSTPTGEQFRCENLSDRAKGYGIPGVTIDGTDVWEVYQTTCDALDKMKETSLPFLIESDCLRLEGHAAYDEAKYVKKEELEGWLKREPVGKARHKLMEVCGLREDQVADLEKGIEEEIKEAIGRALKVGRPSPISPAWDVYAPSTTTTVPPFSAKNVKNGTAVTLALDYLLTHDESATVLGQDIGEYGSAFKTCKGLAAKFGPERVANMPICESATIGFALGASQTGGKPIVEFQFADFGTEAVTQLGLNSGTWFFRSGSPAPIVVRMPCGGGITLGAFHSGEFEGLWSRFPGLKIFYPTTAQEMFEAQVAAFYDPNPCIVLEHKLLYWSKGGDIDFSGDLAGICHPRQYSEGQDITIVAMGAMADVALGAAKKAGGTADLWNPFILKPLDLTPIQESVKRTGRLLVVQESNYVAGLADHIVSQVVQDDFGSLKCAPRVVAPPDTPVPFAKELESVYIPNVAQVQQAIQDLLA